VFQSTPPARGRLVVSEKLPHELLVSIHAPRAGGDLSAPRRGVAALSFNPRPPRGGRRRMKDYAILSALFQSTPPARGATRSQFIYGRVATRFQSTPPARGATRESREER